MNDKNDDQHTSREVQSKLYIRRLCEFHHFIIILQSPSLKRPKIQNENARCRSQKDLQFLLSQK